MIDTLKQNRRILIGAALGAAGLLALLAILPRGQAGNSPTTTDRSEVIRKGPIEVWVTGTGRVEPAALASLSFRVPGTVGVVRVQVGDTVRAGEVLLALDPESLDPTLIGAQADLVVARTALEAIREGPSPAQVAEAELALAQARDAAYRAENRRTVLQPGRRATRETIEAAEANLVLAEEQVKQAQSAYNNVSDLPRDDPGRAGAVAQLDRARRARDTALATYNWYTGKPSEIDQAILDAEVAVARGNLLQAEETLADLRAGSDPDELDAAEARLRAAQAAADQVRLTAPLDATVVSVGYQPGDSVTPGQVAVVLADLSRLHVDTLVDELDVAQVEPGKPVILRVDALPDLTLSGEVGGIDLVPSGGETTAYPVRVVLSDVDPRVRIGMTASVNILAARKESVILVPNWALGVDPAAGEITVRVRRGTQFEVVPIVLGLRSETHSEVLSGLAAGEVVEAQAVFEPAGPSGPFGGGG